MKKNLVALIMVLSLFVMNVWAEDYVWLEGENPTRVNAEVNYAGWGNVDYLSEGNWLSAGADLDKGESVPEGGIIIAYDFETPKSAEYELWNRVCFMNIRSPFDWRIDNGEWRTIEPEKMSTDLMPIAWWNEVSWLPMGKTQLDKGKHTIEIRLLKGLVRGGQGLGEIRYASDVICLYPGAFRPNGKHKPDAEWRSADDVAAEKQVFEMTDAKSGERVDVTLEGLWQYARYDEFPEVVDRDGPIAAQPDADDLYWSSIQVPGERNHRRPDQELCHRYFYRTRVKVPESHAGRSFILRCEEISMLSTVFVNGKQVGFHEAPLTAMQFDISDAIVPGEVNEIWIGIKDFYYAMALADESSRDLEHRFNTPLNFLLDTTQKTLTKMMDYPIKGSWMTGILDDIQVISTGQAYVEDAYVTTSVRDKKIKLALTLSNSGDSDQSVTVANAIRPWKGGDVAKTLASREVNVPANSTIKIDLEEDWAAPRLWWRDDPFLYVLETKLVSGGKAYDAKTTRFGFREWWTEGPRFVLNGVPQHLRADLTHYNMNERDMKKGVTPQQALKEWREKGINHFRLRFQTQWGGMRKKAFLDFCDENGICVRRTISTFDGQHNSYSLTLGRDKEEKAHAALFENWRKQVMSRLKEERQHPSIFVWELDNEILYINGRNDRKLVDPEFEKAAAMIAQEDPTRTIMSGGGNALYSQALPVTGAHYIHAPVRFYPDEAYSLEISASQRFERFDHPPILLHEKPLFIGEANGRSFAPDMLPMVVQGYRWWGLGAYTEWGRMGNYLGMDDSVYRYWSPVAAFVREWNQSIPAGGAVTRTIRVFNDTHYTDPVQFEWSFVVSGKAVQGESKSLNVSPGGHVDLQIVLDVPEGGDADGELLLVCEHRGEETFRDAKPLHILDMAAVQIPGHAAGEIAVLDPEGSAKARLKARGVTFMSIESLDEIPDSAKVVIVGRNAVKADDADSVVWSQIASQGHNIVVLEQDHPLRGQAVPADLGTSEFAGSMVEMAIPSHAILEGLNKGDFHTWSNGHTVYRNVYSKPTRGGRIILHCDVEGDSKGPDYTHTGETDLVGSGWRRPRR